MADEKEPQRSMQSAHLANRIRYAKARHARWIQELRAWGYVVTPPAQLIPPAK